MAPVEKLDIHVSPPIPFTFDLGNLSAFNPNPLAAPSSEADIEKVLYDTTRDGAQLLLNQILTTVPLRSTTDGVLAELPEPSSKLPREKPLPTEKAETKWEKFAKKKGIAPKRKEGKTVYDEATGEWVPKWGYKGKNKGNEDDWAVEVKKDSAEDPRKLNRTERKDRIKKNERQEKKNAARAAAGGKK